MPHAARRCRRTRSLHPKSQAGFGLATSAKSGGGPEDGMHKAKSRSCGRRTPRHSARSVGADGRHDGPGHDGSWGYAGRRVDVEPRHGPRGPHDVDLLGRVDRRNRPVGAIPGCKGFHLFRAHIAGCGQTAVRCRGYHKRCFEVLPIVDEACAFHCPKIRAVNESVDVVYCEETVFVGPNDRRVFGVGLIPLGPGSDDHARAVFLLRAKGESVEESAFRTQLLTDAKSLARRIVSQTWRKGGELRSRSGAST